MMLAAGVVLSFTAATDAKIEAKADTAASRALLSPQLPDLVKSGAVILTAASEAPAAVSIN